MVIYSIEYEVRKENIIAKILLLQPRYNRVIPWTSIQEYSRFVKSKIERDYVNIKHYLLPFDR